MTADAVEQPNVPDPNCPTRRHENGHWLIFGCQPEHPLQLPVTGCMCGFVADESDCGYGDSVLRHFRAVVEAELRARLAAEIEAEAEQVRPLHSGYSEYATYRRAARIVRGESVQGRENIPGNIPAPRCWCARCDAGRRAELPWPACLCAPFIVCPECGDKRCPTPGVYHRALREAHAHGCEDALRPVIDLIRKARKISPSSRAVVYVADLERALGIDAPRPHKTGGGDA